MTRIGNVLLGLSLIFGFSFAMAAGTTVSATVDRSEMSLGDTFTLSVIASSDEDVEAQDPRIPDLDGFEMLNNWQSTAVAQKLVNTGSGMQFQTQRRKEFHYMLSPKRLGVLSLPAIEVNVSGKVFRTQPIVIKVAQGDGNSQQGSQQGRTRPRGVQRPTFEDPFEAMDRAEEDMFNQLLNQRQRLLQMQQQGRGGAPDENRFNGQAAEMPNAAFRSLPTNPNEAFFIGVEVDKTEVFEGEQVTVNWYIYTRGQMETLDRLKFPSLKGFWKEIIEEVPSIQFSEEIVGGVPWKKALLASHALFPIKAGTAAIDEYKIKSRVRTATQGWGYMGKAFEYTKSSSRIPIKVKPLPIEGRPSDFTGAVGQFEVHASVENAAALPVNQPLSLKIRFEGAGNAKLIDLPVLNLPPGLEQYDSKSESKFFKNGRSFKEFEVLLIPRQEGELIIPGLSVSMFDPSSQKYYTRTTESISLKIVNNPNAPVGESSRLGDASKQAAVAKPIDRLPDVLLNFSPSAEAQVWTNPWVWVLVFGGILAVLSLKLLRVLGWHERRQTLQELVQKRYKKIDLAMAANDHRKVGAEMTNVFYVVLAEVAGASGAAEEIHILLNQIPPSLRRDHGDEIVKSFEVFQTLSFAPDEMLGSLKDPEALKTHLEKAKKVIGSVIAAVSTTT